MKIAMIANPKAGGKKGKKRLKRVLKQLDQLAISFEILFTEFPDHAFSIASNLDLTKYNGIVSLGGDGTNYQVLNGILKTHSENILPPFGVIPLGRGNSFARDLNIFNVNDALAALKRNTPRPVDVCQFTQANEKFYFINLLGFGFVTEVAKTALHFQKLGDFSYVLAVLHRSIWLSFHLLHLELDGKIIEKENCFVEFCNSKYTGGNMLMAPDAIIDDGLFDVVLVDTLTRRSLLGTFPKLFKGTHGENPAVSFFQAKHARFWTDPSMNMLPDGELFGSTPSEITIIPNRVRFFQ